eukprot:3673411-Pyramimonas_sp.AAC.1
MPSTGLRRPSELGIELHFVQVLPRGRPEALTHVQEQDDVRDEIECVLAVRTIRGPRHDHRSLRAPHPHAAQLPMVQQHDEPRVDHGLVERHALQ